MDPNLPVNFSSCREDHLTVVENRLGYQSSERIAVLGDGRAKPVQQLICIWVPCRSSVD